MSISELVTTLFFCQLYVQAVSTASKGVIQPSSFPRWLSIAERRGIHFTRRLCTAA
jgi:hypothetical protein